MTPNNTSNHTNPSTVLTVTRIPYPTVVVDGTAVGLVTLFECFVEFFPVDVANGFFVGFVLPPPGFSLNLVTNPGSVVTCHWPAGLPWLWPWLEVTNPGSVVGRHTDGAATESVLMGRTLCLGGWVGIFAETFVRRLIEVETTTWGRKVEVGCFFVGSCWGRLEEARSCVGEALR